MSDVIAQIVDGRPVESSTPEELYVTDSGRTEIHTPYGGGFNVDMGHVLTLCKSPRRLATVSNTNPRPGAGEALIAEIAPWALAISLVAEVWDIQRNRLAPLENLIGQDGDVWVEDPRSADSREWISKYDREAWTRLILPYADPDEVGPPSPLGPRRDGMKVALRVEKRLRAQIEALNAEAVQAVPTGVPPLGRHWIIVALPDTPWRSKLDPLVRARAASTPA